MEKVVIKRKWEWKVGETETEREAERFMLLRVREVDGGETKGFRREMINAEVGRLASSCSLPIRLSIFPSFHFLSFSTLRLSCE